ncbi:helix-turn-helix domain-containing protein [Mycobacterium sp. 852002-51961_SCH5331710]|uniref:helix-turn-helix domain-containing protein n=1 Tax=Mycobacterium sp. 852002-51961_SCH5331710 TaxID=1834105 RepID=UPI0008013F7D|nr:helix-turn-helix domain-containing protein [Mycobacterium sp. 852002-51961_SCH5331710]OBB45994.1 transcriptional regulator [Mycobacterium sp. 852002-51961_SCH5331710]
MQGAGSAPTERVLDIIEILSRTDARGMRFSDVVRRLHLSQGTAHAILTSLQNRGWVTRDPVSKEFSLGPAMALIASRLDAERPTAAVARSAIRRLAEKTGMAASVVERIGDDLVITAFENPSNSPPAALPNDRIPYAPPFGIACAAWDSVAEQEAWVQRGAAGDAALADRLRAALTHTRSRGYDVDRMTPALAEAVHAIGTLSDDSVPGNLRSVVDQLRVEFIATKMLPDESLRGAHSVATISAPVLDSNSRVRLILGVHPLRRMTIRETRTTAEPLLHEIARVSAERSAHATRS